MMASLNGGPNDRCAPMMFFLKARHKVNTDLLIIHHSKRNEKNLRRVIVQYFFSIKYCLIFENGTHNGDFHRK